MTWLVILTLLASASMCVCVSLFARHRRDMLPMRGRLAELEARLANALPDGDPYRKKILPMLEPSRERVYCEDCRFEKSTDSGSICLAQPYKGKYLHLGQSQTNVDHDCTHFQKKPS